MMLLGGISWLHRISHRYFLPIGQGQALGSPTWSMPTSVVSCSLQTQPWLRTQAPAPVSQSSSFRETHLHFPRPYPTHSSSTICPDPSSLRSQSYQPHHPRDFVVCFWKTFSTEQSWGPRTKTNMLLDGTWWKTRFMASSLTLWLPWWVRGKESACQCRRHGFDPWVGKILGRKKWQPTPVFLPGKSLGQRSLVCYIVHEVTESFTI